VVVVEGEAETTEPVVAERPPDGDQEYVLAPDAVNETDCPKQMLAEGGVIVTIGGFPVAPTVSVTVSLQPMDEVTIQ
jgi:hypothetical protein